MRERSVHRSTFWHDENSGFPPGPPGGDYARPPKKEQRQKEQREKEQREQEQREQAHAPFISPFLTDLETKRGAGVKTRNLRLTTIRSSFRWQAFRLPADVARLEIVGLDGGSAGSATLRQMSPIGQYHASVGLVGASGCGGVRSTNWIGGPARASE